MHLLEHNWDKTGPKIAKQEMNHKLKIQVECQSQKGTGLAKKIPTFETNSSKRSMMLMVVKQIFKR